MPKLPPSNPANNYGPYKGSAANHNYVFTNIEISSKEIGKFAMDELKSIDKVAFIRFASVYREFKDLGEFKTQIDDISN